ncbi:DUF1996 domain-containing protein [Streptomyces sp. NPDC052701]|uniref:DUF1996 domain-containing protein n=1 Tax=Streptomyces sp. NPDC052701 TaxID=3155533 RepID=UPI003445AF79
MAANVYASATEGDGDPAGQAGGGVPGASTIDCPDVGTRLTAVPGRAQAEVDKELAALDEQIARAYQQLREAARAGGQDAGGAEEAITEPLKEQRAATIGRITAAIGRAGDRPEGLEALAACTVRTTAAQTPAGQDGAGEDQGDAGGQGQQDGNGGQAGNGPVAADYADITAVQPNVPRPQRTGDASRGSFSTSCGVNENGLFNSDNVIVAPGVSNGAHHFHDYVGNQANDAFASDQDLAGAETTCENQGDKSSYFWPVLRLQNGTREQDADSPGGGIEGNAGEIVTPKQVTLTFVGNPRGKVTAMPRLLRIITGDAKAFVNGPGNANASWSCTGFEDRQLKDKYPLCPQGSDVVRTFRFQSCWDGRNIDSANHRTHVAFADAAGNCPAGFRPIPQLVQRLVYDVDAPSLDDGGRTTPLFAVDSFPEQLHKPVTDHGDFINVFDEDLMEEMVGCINEGRECDAGADSGSGSGEEPQEQPTKAPEAPQEQPTQAPEAPQEQPTQAPEAPQEQPTKAPEVPQDGKGGQEPGDTGGEETEEPPAATPSAGAAGGGSSTPPRTAEPKARTAAPATRGTSAGGDTGDSDGSGANAAGGSGRTPAAIGTPAARDEAPAASGRTQPQAVNGGLAETGAQLWPGAAGGVLLIAGVVLLRRVRRGSA